MIPMLGRNKSPTGEMSALTNSSPEQPPARTASLVVEFDRASSLRRWWCGAASLHIVIVEIATDDLCDESRIDDGWSDPGVRKGPSSM